MPTSLTQKAVASCAMLSLAAILSGASATVSSAQEQVETQIAEQAEDSATTATSQTPSKTVPSHVPPGYRMVWNDEFSGNGLPDASKWAWDTHRNKQGWYNNEEQYYAKSRLKNARQENGHLIIEAVKEDLSGENLDDWGGQEYSSARLITQGLGDWTYGLYEIRAQLPCGTGTWPAIWMLPSDPDEVWPNGGEIDIMEHVGFDPGRIHHSIHTKAFNFGRGTQKTTSYMVEDACTTMHKYQLLWLEDKLIFGIDDTPKFLFEKKRDDQSRWPFNKPMHMLLNIAVGGDWGGQKGVKGEAFPAKMIVDYVRVFQLDPKALEEDQKAAAAEDGTGQ